MNILYLTCHSVLEYDEVKLLGELGYNVLTNGAYKIPSKVIKETGAGRPAITSIKEFPEMVKYLPTKWGGPDFEHWYEKLDPKLVEWADVIMSMGLDKWFTNDIMHKKRVFRSIGQSYKPIEDALVPLRKLGVKVLRYSPYEDRLAGYCGSDGMIRFYKDADEFKGWTGEKKEVINMTQSMAQRGQGCGWNLFVGATNGLPRHLYGRGNKPEVPWITGEISYEEMLKVFRQGRVFLYTGTSPAQYTLAFMEAWMTGTPMVVAGNGLMGWEREVPSWIENGVNGFVGHSVDDLNAYCQMLLEDDQLAKDISAKGRATACQLFDKDRIASEWKAFLEAL